MTTFFVPRAVMAFRWDGSNTKDLKKFLGEDLDPVTFQKSADDLTFRVWLDESHDNVQWIRMKVGDWILSDGISFRRVSDTRLRRAYRELTKEELMDDLVRESEELGLYDMPGASDGQ